MPSEKTPPNASVHDVVTSVPYDETDLQKLKRKAEKAAERLRVIKQLQQRISELEAKIAAKEVRDDHETSVAYCMDTAKVLLQTAELLTHVRQPTTAELAALAST